METGKTKKTIIELNFDKDTFNPFFFDKTDLGLCLDWLDLKLQEIIRRSPNKQLLDDYKYPYIEVDGDENAKTKIFEYIQGMI